MLIVLIAISTIFLYRAREEDSIATNEFEEILKIMEQENEQECMILNLKEVYRINSDVVRMDKGRRNYYKLSGNAEHRKTKLLFEPKYF